MHWHPRAEAGVGWAGDCACPVFPSGKPPEQGNPGQLENRLGRLGRAALYFFCVIGKHVKVEHL